MSLNQVGSSIDNKTSNLQPESDSEIRRILKRRSRRGFTIAGLSAVAGYLGLEWLGTREDESRLPWPLRMMLEGNGRLSQSLSSANRLAPEFPRSAARAPRVNGNVGLEYGLTNEEQTRWSVRIEGLAPQSAQQISLDQIRALPRAEHTTEFKCIEGWSTVVHWAGVRLADLAAQTGLSSRSGRPYEAPRPPADLLPFVGLATPDRSYFVGLDLASAIHPQTLLCYEMNGEPLPVEHGGPLRLVVPIKYGIKNLKRIGSIWFTDQRPTDYWYERGYDWYAGH